MPEWLFVYGTLCPSQAEPTVRHLVQRFRQIGQAYVRGRLFDCGEYTGIKLVENEDSAIGGELVEVPDDEKLWAELDNYEEFDAADESGSLFIRKHCAVMTEDGQKSAAWIYEYNQSINGLLEKRPQRMNTEATATEEHEGQNAAENAAETIEINLENIRALESRYIMQTYARQPVLFVRGKGSTLFDDAGKAYTDFISGIGVNVLGYDHPVMRRVLREQASLLHTSNLYYHPYQALLAERLAKASGLDRVFFANTGTETTEGAMKLARAYHKRAGRPEQYEFISLNNSFHGRTFGALSLTANPKYREPFEPLVPGVKFIDANDCADNFGAARAAITEKTAAIVIETIQGEGGIYPISDAFLQVVRERCDEVGALLILDEVQCGLGRTGKVFAFQNTSVKPDILTVAKPLGMGVPLGAVMASEKVAAGLKPGDHGTTFGGGPLATRMSLEFMKLLEEGGLMQRVIETGNYFRKKLRRLQRDLPEHIKEVRGLGLMVGVELNFSGGQVMHQMRERGFLLNCTHDVTLRFLPPYIITKAEIKALIENLAEVIPAEAAKAAEAAAAAKAGETPRP